jgi:hypothetical protein
MTRTVSILDIDRFVPFLSEDEQRDIVEAMAAGSWTVEMDSDRYDELWALAPMHNAEIITRTEEAMKKAVHR